MLLYIGSQFCAYSTYKNLNLYNIFVCSLQSVFKRLYKNSGRESGTLRYFREVLNRRNVNIDIKHYEACEQLFISIGQNYLVEALLEFFKMDDMNQSPNENNSLLFKDDLTEEERKEKKKKKAWLKSHQMRMPKTLS